MLPFLTYRSGCWVGCGCLSSIEGWTTSRFCGVPARWSTRDPSWHGHNTTGVSLMGEDLRSGPVRGNGEPVLGVQVSSDALRSWVTLRGELDLASAPHLQDVLDQLCRDGFPEIVLNLSGLKFLSAAGLAVFHRVDEHLRAVSGQLILHQPGRLARRALVITGLDTVLTIRPATERSLICTHQRGRRDVLTHGGCPE